MLFNSVVFWWFFTAFFVLYRFVAQTREHRLWLITLGSLFFYGAWDYRFVGLLLATALFDFYVARAIDREQENPARKRYRKRLLVLSIAVNLGVLGLFKYLNFFIASFFDLLHLFGIKGEPPELRIILPIGISFYTFQSMSYTIDVYRRQLKARQRPVEFVAAVTFFPHLVAGPIIRASTLLPQFERMTSPSWSDIKRGYLLIAIGLFNKNIADLLSPTVNALFGSDGPHDALQAWTGALAFAGQIYGDFAGYTGVAIGVALLLGFKIPPNFNLPYLATSVVDHWRRWHISLSTWLRDYLFLPLALKYPRHPYLNVTVTMMLAGLWHGASWTYLVFGVYHGVLIATTEIVSNHYPDFIDRIPSRLLKAVQIGFTFYLVTLAFTLFRAQSFTRALSIFRDLHWPRSPAELNESTLLELGLVLAAIVVGHLASSLEVAGDEARILKRPFVLWPVVVACVAFAVIFGQTEAFIYFQF
jgi:alginate O-acetyltransferase complex protein AlgI